MNLGEYWEGAIKKKQRNLIGLLIHEVACNLEMKDIPWIRVNPEVDALYQLLDGLRPEEARRFS